VIARAKLLATKCASRSPRWHLGWARRPVAIAFENQVPGGAWSLQRAHRVSSL